MDIVVKAKIDTDTGTKIVVEGTVEEVTTIVNALREKPIQIQGREISHAKQKRETRGAVSLVDMILRLKAENFFNKPRKISDVKAELDKKAHIYPIYSISTALIRRVKHGDLGRVQEGSTWAHVKR